jgi:hypothetical protein
MSSTDGGRRGILDSMRRIALVPLAVAAALALVGCSVGSPMPAPEVSGCANEAADAACVVAETIDFDELLAGWEQRSSILVLPDGTELRAPQEDDYPDTDAFSEGEGEALADVQAFCAWQGEWLGIEDKQSVEAGEAVDHLREFLATDTFLQNYGGSPVITRAVEAAAQGDPQLLQDDHDLNCSTR